MNKMPRQKPETKSGGDRQSGTATTRWLVVIGAALAAWCALIVAGIIRGQAEFDYRKPLILFSVFALFAILWATLLWRGKSKRG